MSTHNNMKKYIYIETKWRSNSNIKSSIQTYKQTNQTVLAQCNEKRKKVFCRVYKNLENNVMFFKYFIEHSYYESVFTSLF